MENKKEPQNLSDETTSEEEINLLKQGLITGKKRERRLRWAVMALVVAASLLLIFGSFGWGNSSQARSEAATAQSNLYHVAIALGTVDAQNNEAQNQAQAARALQLASQAQKIFVTQDGERETAVLLAIQSMLMFPSGEAAQVIQNNTLAKSVSSMAYDSAITSVDFSPDGAYVVGGSWDNTARVWMVDTGKEVARMVHGAVVNSVAFSPNGRYVVSGGCDQKEGYSCSRGSARVWDGFTGLEIARMEHGDWVTFVTFSPDGKYVVSSACGRLYDANLPCNEGFARVWEVTTGEEVARLAHNFYVSTVAFSSDGNYIVSGGCDEQGLYGYCDAGFVRVWEVSTKEEIAVMKHSGFVTSVTFSPNGEYVASGSWDRTARVWDVLSGKEVSRIPDDYFVTSVAFSPDSRFVISTGRIARLWEAETGREITRFAPYDGVLSAFFSSDGKNLLTSGSSTARIWDTTTGQEITRMMHNRSVTSIALSLNGKYVVSGSEDGNLRVWNTVDQDNVRKIHHNKFVSSFDFSLDGKYVVSSSEDGIIRVWNTSKGEEIFNTGMYGSYIDAIDMSPDGKHVASVIRNREYDWNPWVNTISVWDVATGQEITHIVQDGLLASIAFSPDAKYIASGGYDHVIQIWDVSTGQETINITFDNEFVSSIAFSSDGRYLVSGGKYSIHIWEISTGKEIGHMMPHEYDVLSVAFSPDGKYVVSGGSFTVQVWEVFTGKEIARMTTDDGVFSVAFSPDGKYVVSGGGGTVRMWEASTGQEIARMTQNSVRSVAFTSDGKYIFSGSYMGDVRVWKWHPDDLIADACSRVTRNLTRAEWQQYIGNVLPYQAICPDLPMEPESIPIPITTPTLVPTETPIPTETSSSMVTPTSTATP